MGSVQNGLNPDICLQSSLISRCLLICSARIYPNFPTCKHFSTLTFLSIFARAQGGGGNPFKCIRAVQFIHLDQLYQYIMHGYKTLNWINNYKVFNLWQCATIPIEHEICESFNFFLSVHLSFTSLVVSQNISKAIT